jgi:PAS domain S-box-containing protein
MKIHIHSDNITQATLYSFIGAVILLAFGVFSLFTTEISAAITFTSIIKAFTGRPVLWILASLVIILPVVIFFIYYSHWKRINGLQAYLDEENKKDVTISGLVSDLIQEDFDSDFILENKNDKLGKSLIELRDTMKKNKDIAEKRRREDEIRNWSAEGMAKFGEILRSDNNNLERLAYNVIKNLTDYIGGIEGGFYLLNSTGEEKTHFDLIAFYAFGRKKYAEQQIKWGKGIIGTCAIERKIIHITEVPDSYISVTSGLGKTNPRSLLVSPMIANDELFGIFEIASLVTLEKHHIDFVQRVSESTASILSTVKMNMQTAKLLEESKSQAQTLASQEEEMRQNMEELQATQEEAARQAERFLKLENTVNHTMLRAEYNTEGRLIYANTNFLHKLEYTSNSEVEGKPISMFISKKDEEWFKRMWNSLAAGGRHYEGYMKHVTKNDKDLWTMATYTCIRDENDNVERILFLGLDTTEHKKLSLSLEGIVDAVNRASIKIVFDINGNIKEYNESFQYLFKYTEKDLIHLTVFDLIDTLELELFNKKWENIVRGMNFQGHFKVKTKNEEEKWIRGAFSAVYNMYGEVEKVVYIGNDITNEKLMEIETKQQHDVLKKQEKLLRESEKELSRKLKEARQEMKEQFKEIEQIKIRNERTLEGALDAIITTSHDNKILFFNHAAELLAGYAKEEVLGKNIGMLFDTDTVDQDEFLQKYTGPGDHKIVGQRKEVKIKTKNGEEKPVLVLLSKAHVEKETTYTAFIQTIEVELF